MVRPDGNDTHKLELHGHQAEVDDLYRRPDGVVRLQGRHIHVSQLVVHSATTSTLSNSHDGEETGHTERRKDQLIESHSLHGRYEGARLRHGEGLLEELEPPKLHRCHHEAVRHESRQSLEVEGWRQDLRVGDEFTSSKRVLLVELEGDGIVSWAQVSALLPQSSFSDGCDGLCDGICYASEDGIGHHHGENCISKDHQRLLSRNMYADDSSR